MVISFGDQRVVSNLNKNLNASSGGQGKYTKYVSFSLPPLEAVISIFSSRIVLLRKFL
jgi:hypothetical protein